MTPIFELLILCTVNYKIVIYFVTILTTYIKQFKITKN